MKSSLLLCALAAAAGVAASSVGPLPAATFPDTEVSTNVPFTFARDRAGLFTLVLELSATPSNNVEVALGTDGDADGVLEPEETGLTLGWDCGQWLLREGWAGPVHFAEPVDPEDGKTLRWVLRLTDGRTPRRLSVTENGTPLGLDPGSDGMLPAWLFREDWDLMRVTARGVDAPGAELTFRVHNEAFILRLR